MLVFIAALRHELSRLEPLIQVHHRIQAGPCLIAHGAVGGLAVALAQTGVGKARAQEGAQAIIESCRPEAVISTGFAGGVSPEVKAGDLILAERLYPLDPKNVAGSGWPLLGHPLSSDAALVEAASLALQEARLPVHRGGLLTIPNLAGPALKRWIGTRCPVKAVDMESYWIAQAMSERGIPFLAVRAASDEVGDALPDYQRFLDDFGEVRPPQAAAYFLAHPHKLLPTLRLEGKARRAAQNLGAFASLFLSQASRVTPERSHEPGR